MSSKPYWRVNQPFDGLAPIDYLRGIRSGNIVPTIENLREALRMVLKDWQPIETAPKDGSYITDTNLELALSKTLFAHDARLLECDLEASAKAASEVSNLLGCLMATILARDPDNFEKAFGIVVENVRKAAVRTASKAASATPDLTSH